MQQGFSTSEHDPVSSKANVPWPGLKKTRVFWLLAALLLLIFCAYWPGLTGDFVFDDGANIVRNKKIAMTSLDFRTLASATWSGEAGPLGRPVSMLTFALNHYFTGFDPYAFKLTNLFIHLINTVLVFWLARSFLFRFSSSGREDNRIPDGFALLAAALWGLHPLNLTSVLYVVQRMTSLSALFGFLALGAYAARRVSPRPFSPPDALTGGFIALCLLASVFAKESGVLFIPLILWTELLVFRGERADGQAIRLGVCTLRQALWGLCAVGVLLVLFELPNYLRPENFYNRGFTALERGLTESRVLFLYLRLIFLPSLSELSLYHDDFTISHGLWQPPETLFSLIGLAAITLTTIIAARKNPLWLFAWGWFLIAHALESTVFSLELVHEHRNYFATIGFVTLIAWLAQRVTPKIRSMVFLMLGAFIGVCAFITWQRAIVWGDSITHASFEAETHPQSDRANYQLGWVYLQYLSRTEDAQFARLAESAFRKNMNAYMPGNNAWFALLHLAYHQGTEPDAALVSELTRKLREEPLQNANVASFAAFADCHIQQFCHMPYNEVIALFAAALENPKSNNLMRAAINKTLGRYFADGLSDLEKGEEFMRDALNLHEDVNGYLLLAQILRLRGDFAARQQALQAARALDHKKSWTAEIEEEESLSKR